MSLITPDFGLLFWMTLIFAIVFFILAKFGFPVITKMVRGRQERIETSIRQAKEIEARVEEMAREHAGMLEETRREQARILREATKAASRSWSRPARTPGGRRRRLSTRRGRASPRSARVPSATSAARWRSCLSRWRNKLSARNFPPMRPRPIISTASSMRRSEKPTEYG